MDNISEDIQSNDENVVKMSENNIEDKQQISETSQSSSNSWWSSLVQKSSHTFESIKKDLNELKQTVQNTETLGVVTNTVSNTASYVTQTMRDTITGISQTINEFEGEGPEGQSSVPQTDANDDHNEDIGKEVEDKSEEIEDKESDDWAIKLTNRAKDKLSSFMGTIADAFLMNRNYYEDEDEMYVLSGNKLVAIDKWQQLLSEVQNDPKTYINEPMGAPEDYESWLMTFNLIDCQRQMDQMLRTVPQMNTLYTQLVPKSLSDVEFWHRYYYRVHQLRETERKKIDDKTDPKGMTTEESRDSKKCVEITLLEENKQIKHELIESSDLKSISDSSDAHKSDTGSAGSDDWEKTDIIVSDEEKDWEKCE